MYPFLEWWFRFHLAKPYFYRTLINFSKMKKSYLSLFALLLQVALFSQNALPVISNVQIDLGANDVLTLTFDLEDAENDECAITFRAGEKGGLTLAYDTQSTAGDVGAGIMPGVGKSIEWDYSGLGISDSDFRLMLVADDGQTVDIQAIVDAVDSTELSGNLSFIEGIRHRTAGLPHLEETQDFIRLQFMDKGLETTEQTWASGSYTARNIIGRQIGTAEEATTYILDGHYDTVSDAPGADDNGSAVAGMIEALRILSPYSFKKSVRYIGFDLEEAGLVGSLRYVDEGIENGESIAGVLNFEMIGFYSEEPNSQTTPNGFGLLFPDAVAALEANDYRGDFVNVVGDQNSLDLIAAYETAAETYVPDLSIIPLDAPTGWAVLTPDLGRSDHAAFWLENIPALMLTDGANFRNPYYHSPEDTADKLNYTFMRHVTQAAVATLAELAEIQHATTWWTDTEFFTPTIEVSPCEFTISPNPVDNILRVEWAACQPGDFELQLIDLQGRTVRQHTRLASQSLDKQIVDVRDLEAGIYFVQLKSENGQWVERVIVE